MISKHPSQLVTILYNDVEDSFIYRIYRPKEGTVFEKVLTSV